MGNRMKKLICAFLSASMLVSSFGLMAFAEDETTTTAAETTEATETVSPDADVTAAPEEDAEGAEATEAPAEEATEAPAEETEAPAVTTPASTAYDKDSYYNKSLALCSSLGIISGYEDGSVRPESSVTRAEMASIVLRLLKISSTSPYQNSFTDVDASHWAANQIQTALDHGIVNGMGDGTFQPDGNVTYAQVVVMLVNAMGYQQDAKYYAQEGAHWATGYLKAANMTGLELLKSASGSNDEPADRGTVIKMAYNALLGYYNEANGYDTGGVTYKATRTLMEAKFDVIEEKGMIVGTSKTSLTSTDLDDNQVEILKDDADDDKADVYDTILTGLEDYLAQKITYYYRENSGRTPEVLAVADNSKSEIYTIDDVDDIESLIYNDDEWKIKLTGGSKAKDFTGAKIIYNGKLASEADIYEWVDDNSTEDNPLTAADLLLPEKGSIKMVKSDKSKDAYDVVFIDSYEIMIVSSATDEKLTGKVSVGTTEDPGATTGITINLDDTEDRTITVTKEGDEIRLRNLKKDDVACIKRSLDDTVVDIVVTGESVTGSATSITTKLDSGKATVAGTKYDVANIALDDLKTGSQCTFYLDMFGRIAYIESANSDGQLNSGEKYGWIMNMYQSESGQDFIVQMMTTDGKAVELDAGTSLDYWGPTDDSNRTLKGSDVEDTLSTLLSSNGFIKDSKNSTPIRLVKYKVNSSGTLSRLYCAVDKTTTSNDDALIVDKTNLKDVPVVSTLVSGYKIPDGLLEISVPKNIADMKDADNYKIGTVTSSVYVVRENGSTRDYIVGEFTDSNSSNPSLIVNFTAASDALANLDDIDTNGNNPTLLIEEIEEGVDDDDNVVYTIHGYSGGAEATVTTTKNTVVGKISTKSAIINNARDYLRYTYTVQENGVKETRDLWDAKHGANDGSGRDKLTDILAEGDLILYDGAERIIQLLDADEVYNVVVNGESSAGLLFGSFNPFAARNMFSFGPVIEHDADDTAMIYLDTEALNTLSFDTSKLMDTVEININTGKADIDTEGSEIFDIETFDEADKTGDYAFARFADKGTLQEIVIYRFVK